MVAITVWAKLCSKNAIFRPRFNCVLVTAIFQEIGFAFWAL